MSEFQQKISGADLTTGSASRKWAARVHFILRRAPVQVNLNQEMTGRPETDLPVLNVGLVGDLACTPKVLINFRGALCHITRRTSHTQGISGCPGRIARFFRDSPRKQGQTPLHPTCPGKKSKYFRDRPPRRDTLSPESSDKDLFYIVKINFNIMALSPYYALYHIFLFI